MYNISMPRPRQYPTPEALEAKIEEYFEALALSAP